METTDYKSSDSKEKSQSRYCIYASKFLQTPRQILKTGTFYTWFGY